MKNEYRRIFDKIEPKAELESKVLDFDKANKRITFAPRKVAALVLAAALMIAGSSFGVYQLSIKPIEPKAIISTTEKVLDTNNRFTIVAYAQDNENTVKTLSKELSTQLEYQIIREDIRGKSEEEIERIREEIKQKYNDGQQEQSYDTFRRQIQRLDHALIGRMAIDYFDINVDKPEEVKKVSVSNESDYGEICIHAIDQHFDDDGNVVVDSRPYDFANEFIRGRNVSLSGERFEKCKRLEAIEANGEGKLFIVNWEMSDALWQAIDKNVDMDLSTVSDVVTFTVEYKDGSQASSKVQINFSKEGKMSVKLLG